MENLQKEDVVMILFHLIKVISQTLHAAVGLCHHMKIFNNSSSHFYTTYNMPGTVLNAFAYIKHFTLTKSYEVVAIIILQIGKLNSET